MNIDVKAFADGFYRDTCGGRLAPVQRTVEMAHAGRVHVEVTTLLVPGLNDDSGQLRELARWLGGLDRSIPLHLSRYFPNYQMAEPGPTPASVLLAARSIAREFLDYVYVGNAFEVESADTECPACGAAVIRRHGYRVDLDGLGGRGCARCGNQIVAGPRGRDVVD
jgi:pyruvate formate lyase activating enzyme